MYDELVVATSQEKFLMMINERVGMIEEKMFELHTLVSGISDFLMVDTLSCYISLPQAICSVVDDAFLEKFVVSVEKTPRVNVAETWVVVHAPHVLPPSTAHRSVSVYMRLKKSVIVKQVADKMNAHIIKDFGFPGISYVQDWREASLTNIESVCLGGSGGKPDVFYKLFVE